MTADWGEGSPFSITTQSTQLSQYWNGFVSYVIRNIDLVVFFFFFLRKQPDSRSLQIPGEIQNSGYYTATHILKT